MLAATRSLLAFLLGLCLLASAGGCSPTTFGDYPRAPVKVTPLASPAGWTRVEEPRWFSASMPGEPTTRVETIGVEDAHVEVKALSATDRKTLFTWIRYFEVSSVSTMLDADALVRAGRRDFLGIDGVSFVRDEPRKGGGPALDFVCSVAPRSPLAPSDTPMVARVRAYGHVGPTNRIVFAVAVWPAGASDEAARAFFDALRVAG